MARILSVMMIGMIFLTVLNRTAQARTPGSFEGFVTIEPGKERYVRYIAPEKGEETVAMLNGLTYRVGSWDRFLRPFAGSGVGTLEFDMNGHGQSLIRGGPLTGPVTIEEQAREFYLILRALNINVPVHLATLSYGGAVGLVFAAEHPELTASLIEMAPLTAPVESQDKLIRFWIGQTRMVFPEPKVRVENPLFISQMDNEQLYDFYLMYLVYATYPLAEPIIWEHPLKLPATYFLVQGARHFLAKNYIKKLPPGILHLMIARQDQYLTGPVLTNFWNEVPPEVRASLLYINDSDHKIPEFVPDFAAGWVIRIMQKHKDIKNGNVFEGYPKRGVAESGSIRIDGIGSAFPKRETKRELEVVTGYRKRTSNTDSTSMSGAHGRTCEWAWSK